MRLLAIDIGMGTSDILVYDSRFEMENCPKLVIPSATRVVADQIRRATGDRLPVMFSGSTMGGGPCGKAMREHLESGLEFYATPEAALTFNDDLERVRSWGVKLVEKAAYGPPDDAVDLHSGDVDVVALLEVLERLGISPDFDGAAVAVQDHGFAPGVSNRRRRFELWREALKTGGGMESLAWTADIIPGHYTRMGSVAGILDCMESVAVMDTGPAALWGVLAETGPGPVLAVNMGNGHTLAAVVDGEKISGLVEHHTGMLDPASLKLMLARFTDATLTDDDVYEDGGHGCIPPAEPMQIEWPIMVTGPRRAMFRDTGLPYVMAAPYGDMMLSGCFGLVQAFRRINAGLSS